MRPFLFFNLAPGSDDDAMPIDPGYAARDITAIVALLGFLLVSGKLLLAIGKLVTVVEKVPAEMDGIRTELRESSKNTLTELRESNKNTLALLTTHGERIAVVEAMLNLDDTAQARTGPRRRSRRGGEA